MSRSAKDSSEASAATVPIAAKSTPGSPTPWPASTQQSNDNDASDQSLGGAAPSPMGVGDATVEAIARNCPALENLGLFGCEAVTDASVVLLASGCPRLETLFLTSRRVSDRSIIPILQCCPEVRFLDLRGPELTDAFVEQLIRQPPWRMVAREYSRISIHNGPSRERLFAFHQLCHRNVTIFVGEWELNRDENEWRCARYASNVFQPAPAPAPPTPGGFSSDESESTDEDDVVTVRE